ncbi:dephospho-CoA kinase [Maritalea mobilis]|uniref:dephospho-CoA kinase n=1 Tax=Maritalea mobilis TaxID=483324 RepID=UPI001C98BD61|nr:dephospho-CoA kinase [Maritalea mobilis]MBY6201567.1 dephospho-CoA kinase [Maritalea mobilis]
MTVKLGLTGSIGMGKSTTAQMFRDLGIPVWDADAAVHRLYSTGGAAVAPLSGLVPAAVVRGEVDRTVLKTEIKKDPELLNRIEKIVHPLVAEDRKSFLEAHKADNLVVLDIPLLFETGGQGMVDAVVVVSTDEAEQRRRVLDRPGMTAEQFETIRARQMPDAEKRARADHVIRTDTLEDARAAVADIVSKYSGDTNA